jgi:hypothetical protein
MLCGSPLLETLNDTLKQPVTDKMELRRLGTEVSVCVSAEGKLGIAEPSA